MKIDYPAEAQMPQLRALWQEAFADEAPFIDAFFATAFGADRCLCATEGQNVAAALYWLDCRLEGRPLAYLYAIATARQYRRRGFCRGLIDRAKAHLQELGYAGLLLVPGDAGLARMYEDMGFAFCTHVREFTCHRGDPPVTLRALEPAEYARLRRDYLPDGGVSQEGDSLRFLSAVSRFYAGEDFLFAQDAELLGNTDAAPGILAALGKEKGTFRTPGEERPFAMYYPLAPGSAPRYFGLAFD